MRRGHGSGRFAPLLGIIVLGALVLRLAYLFIAEWGEELTGDAIYYSPLADTLADGGGFNEFGGGPSAEHPPLTSLVLAPVSLLTGGDSADAHRFAMTLLGAAVVALVALAGRRIGGDRVGLIAGAIAAVHPGLWINDAQIMSETLAAGCIALALLAAYSFLDEPTPRRAYLIAAVCAVASLVRGEATLWIVLLLVPLVLGQRRWSWRERLTVLVASGWIALTIVSPWVLHNLVRFEEPVLMATSLGLTIGGANCEPMYQGEGKGLWTLDPSCIVPREPGDDASINASRSLERGLEYMGENVGRLPVVMLTRVGRVWSFYAPVYMIEYNLGEGRDLGPNWMALLGYWALIQPAIIGLVVARRRSIALWPLLMPFVSVTLIAAAFFGLIRFRVTAEVAMVILAALAADAGLDALRRPNSRPETETATSTEAEAEAASE